MAVNVPPELNWLLDILAGQSWPQGDEDALRRCSQAWMDAMLAIGNLADCSDVSAQSVMLNADSTSSDQFQAFWSHYTSKTNPGFGQSLNRQIDPGNNNFRTTFGDLFGQCETLAGNLVDQANEVEYTKLVIVITVIITAIMIAMAVAEAIATLGASLVEAGLAIAIGREAVIMAIARFLQMALMMLVPDLLAQGVLVLQHKGWDWNKTISAGENAIVGGLIGSFLGAGVGKLGWMGEGGNRFLQLATHFVEGGLVNDATAVTTLGGQFIVADLRGDKASMAEIEQQLSFSNLAHQFLQGGLLSSVFYLPHMAVPHGTAVTFTATDGKTTFRAIISDKTTAPDWTPSDLEDGQLPTGVKLPVFNDRGIRVGTVSFDGSQATVNGLIGGKTYTADLAGRGYSVAGENGSLDTYHLVDQNRPDIGQSNIGQSDSGQSDSGQSAGGQAAGDRPVFRPELLTQVRPSTGDMQIQTTDGPVDVPKGSTVHYTADGQLYRADVADGDAVTTYQTATPGEPLAVTGVTVHATVPVLSGVFGVKASTTYGADGQAGEPLGTVDWFRGQLHVADANEARYHDAVYDSYAPLASNIPARTAGLGSATPASGTEQPAEHADPVAAHDTTGQQGPSPAAVPLPAIVYAAATGDAFRLVRVDPPPRGGEPAALGSPGGDESRMWTAAGRAPVTPDWLHGPDTEFYDKSDLNEVALYALYRRGTHEFLKIGISEDPRNVRYRDGLRRGEDGTKEEVDVFVVGKFKASLAGPPRPLAEAVERYLVERWGGPDNFEPWARSAVPDNPGEDWLSVRRLLDSITGDGNWPTTPDADQRFRDQVTAVIKQHMAAALADRLSEMPSSPKAPGADRRAVIAAAAREPVDGFFTTRQAGVHLFEPQAYERSATSLKRIYGELVYAEPTREQLSGGYYRLSDEARLLTEVTGKFLAGTPAEAEARLGIARIESIASDLLGMAEDRVAVPTGDDLHKLLLSAEQASEEILADARRGGNSVAVSKIYRGPAESPDAIPALRRSEGWENWQAWLSERPGLAPIADLLHRLGSEQYGDWASAAKCVHSALAYEASRRTGELVTPTELPERYVDGGRSGRQLAGLASVFGESATFTELPAGQLTGARAALTRIFKEFGDGARGMVAIGYADGTGHVINIENVRGRVVFADALDGKIDAVYRLKGTLGPGKDRPLVTVDYAGYLRTDNLNPVAENIAPFINLPDGMSPGRLIRPDLPVPASAGPFAYADPSLARVMGEGGENPNATHPPVDIPPVTYAACGATADGDVVLAPAVAHTRPWALEIGPHPENSWLGPPGEVSYQATDTGAANIFPSGDPEVTKLLHMWPRTMDAVVVNEAPVVRRSIAELGEPLRPGGVLVLESPRPIGDLLPRRAERTVWGRALDGDIPPGYELVFKGDVSDLAARIVIRKIVEYVHIDDDAATARPPIDYKKIIDQLGVKAAEPEASYYPEPIEIENRYGIPQVAQRWFQRLADRYGLAFKVRPSNPDTVPLAELGGVPKPAALKMKTINAYDVLLGARDMIGAVGYFDPKLPEQSDLPADLWTELAKYWPALQDRFSQRVTEYADYSAKVAELTRLRQFRVVDGVVYPFTPVETLHPLPRYGPLVVDPVTKDVYAEGQTGAYVPTITPVLDPELGPPVRGDYDVFDIVFNDNQPLPYDRPDVPPGYAEPMYYKRLVNEAGQTEAQIRAKGPETGELLALQMGVQHGAIRVFMAHESISQHELETIFEPIIEKHMPGGEDLVQFEAGKRPVLAHALTQIDQLSLPPADEHRTESPVINALRTEPVGPAPPASRPEPPVRYAEIKSAVRQHGYLRLEISDGGQARYLRLDLNEAGRRLVISTLDARGAELLKVAGLASAPPGIFDVIGHADQYGFVAYGTHLRFEDLADYLRELALPPDTIIRVCGCQAAGDALARLADASGYSVRGSHDIVWLDRRGNVFAARSEPAGELRPGVTAEGTADGGWNTYHPHGIEVDYAREATPLTDVNVGGHPIPLPKEHAPHGPPPDFALKDVFGPAKAPSEPERELVFEDGSFKFADVPAAPANPAASAAPADLERGQRLAAFREHFIVPEARQSGPAEHPPAWLDGEPGKILLVTTFWKTDQGGIPVFNQELAKALAAAGHEVYVAVLDEDLPQRVQRIDGVTLFTHASDLPAQVDAVIGHTRFTGQQAQELRENFYPDALLVHFQHMVPGGLGEVKAGEIIYRAPRVRDYTDVVVEEADGKVTARFVARDFGDDTGVARLDDPYQPGETVGAAFFSELRKAARNEAMERELVRKADLGIGVGPAIAADARMLAGDGQVPLVREVIPGLDFSRVITPPPLDGDGKPADGQYNVLLIGRADEAQKGALEAADMIRKLSGPDLNVHLIIRGFALDRPDEMRSMAAQLTARAGVPVEVRPFTTDPDELTADLSEAHLVIAPGSGEGFGMSAAGAAAVGLPVLVPRSSGYGMFLDQTAGIPAAIRDTLVDQGFADQIPVDRWVGQIGAMLNDLPAARKNAAELARLLQSPGQDRTWSGTAKSLLDALREVYRSRTSSVIGALAVEFIDDDGGEEG